MHSSPHDRPRGVVVAVSPHADDAEYGAGGLLAAYADAGYDVLVALMTGAHPNRLREAEAAARVLGARVVADGSGCDGALEVTSARVRWLERLTADAQVVLAPHPDDTHQDHRAATAITRSSVRRSSVSLIWYRTPSSGPGFTPTAFHPVSPAHAHARATAIAMHRSQSHCAYLSSHHLAVKDAWHGWLSGHAAAEPFEVARYQLTLPTAPPPRHEEVLRVPAAPMPSGQG
ncbi:PIG-L deacetylase family protein [Saccharothrix algeriensis]|uniref:LmbE family N-acetylglucosaminyl deacetylase n=1 Tax=Saccharothrix algeriensis TaxID=173560 RepID=A0ABS2SED3_9PSEU|nr:PIG-L family deacetylase [Saccharothrix algeriensis]MBM7814290.1 LmbE family N-acetylglucosaminyl deacetylase [Saccharothrix algeriensis]